MDEMEPVVLENKSFDSLESSKLFALAGHFAPFCLWCKKRIAKNIIEWCFTIARLLIEFWLWEIQPVVLKGIEFDYQNISYENAF